MKIRFYILFICVLITIKIEAQEVQFGFVSGMNLYQKIKVERAIYSPIDGYITFLEKEEGKGLVNSNNVFNSVHLGTIFNMSFRKFSFNIEPQYYYKKSRLEFETPNNTQWMLAEKGFRLPMYFTYKVFKGQKSVYLMSGLIYTKTKSTDFQYPGFSYFFGGDEIYEYNPYYGKNLFKDVLYNDYSYWNLMIGFGKQMKNVNTSIRFETQLGSKNHPIDSKVWQVEVSFRRFIFSSKDVTKKHFLYVE
jgi:hypothetical protein